MNKKGAAEMLRKKKWKALQEDRKRTREHVRKLVAESDAQTVAMQLGLSHQRVYAIVNRPG